MPKAYYNEIDKYCVAWLRNLIAEGLIADGDVDDRSIADVKPNDLAGYTQCHFFAGLGGWSGALRLAGWPNHRAVWTGSCPCQPFSLAGRQGGFADERHLWPFFYHHIRVGRPAVVFGEQVASAADWLRLVRSDLEALDYAVGCIPVEAASAGADHFRDRYFFVADDNLSRLEGRNERAHGTSEWFIGPSSPEHRIGSLPDPNVKCEGNGDLQRSGQQCRSGSFTENSSWTLQHATQFGWGEGWTEYELRSRGITTAVASLGNSQIIECPDGKWRRLPPPGVRWLGVGIPARVAKLRALGNAVDLRPAAAFIRACT